MDRYYVQNVLRATYANGAVQHTYYQTRKYYYIDLFEQNEQDMDPVRYAILDHLQKQVIDELLKPYPPVVIFENGTWLHQQPPDEPISYTFLEKLEDVGEPIADERPIRIERIQLRKEL